MCLKAKGSELIESKKKDLEKKCNYRWSKV